MDRLRILLVVKKNDEFSKKLITFLKSKKIVLKYLFTNDKNNKLFKKKLESWSGDLLFSFRNRYIFKKKFLKNNIKIAAVNFHSGPPEYRGIGGINFAIFEKRKFFGVTAHLISEKIDTGKILKVKRFKIKKDWDLKKTLDKTHKELFILSKKIIDFFYKKRKSAVKVLLSKTNEKWSKRLYTLKRLNKLYEINKDFSEKKIRLVIKSTNLDQFKPFIKLKNIKFYYVN